MDKNEWIRTKVQKGDQSGRLIGFPSANLDPSVLAGGDSGKQGKEQVHWLPCGVYAAEVEVAGKKYLGALYFGPRLVKNETHNVLEIHIINFTGQIYGETIGFKIGRFIRGVMDFKNMEELKLQLAKDIAAIAGR